MPPVELAEKESTAGKSIVGIIYPPPEVRNIVDKTASFVARNGFEFENRIRQNELNNPKFNFLNSQDPYHAYYQHKVKEFQEGKAQEPAVQKITSGLGLAVPRLQEQAKIAEQPILPKDPPPEVEFITDPPSISAMDLDIVKLTAQFVSRNGKSFLTTLMDREQRNFQFDFLRPQHSLFNYFTKLVEQYTKIMIPPKDLLPKLRKDIDNPKVILDGVKYRVEWLKFQEREKQKEEDEKERERVAYAQIDWHDFVVVETVDFQPNEGGNLPPPTTPEEVGARVLAQERFEATPAVVDMEEGSDDESDEGREGAQEKKAPDLGVDVTVQDMEEGSDEELSDEDEGPPQPPHQPVMDRGIPPPPLPPPPPPKDVPQPPPLPPTPDEVVIKEYNPKAAKPMDKMGDNYLISPLTGERIPAEKMPEHLRVGLLDPNWIAHKDRSISDKRDQEEVYAPGSAIETQLKQLAERRTDIFGPSIDEAEIGKKIGEEEDDQQERVIWDGHSASMDKVSQKARENISIEDQIKVIHKVKGLVSDEEKERIGPSTTSAPSSIPPPASSAPAPPPMPRATIQPPKNVPPPPRPPMPMLGNPVMAQQHNIMVVQPPMPPVLAMPMPPRPAMMPPFQPPQPPSGPMHGLGKQPAKPSDDEPPNKRAKTEEQLIPEGIFLSQHPEGIVSFKVAIANITDKNDWKCNGQTLTFTLPLTDTVSVIKAKLHEETLMPVGKQKLHMDGMFIKDSNTLAFYNVTKDSVVQMQLKERGGRKK